ncbi:MAG: serine hydrolase [Planctomycetota bacterium]
MPNRFPLPLFLFCLLVSLSGTALSQTTLHSVPLSGSAQDERLQRLIAPLIAGHRGEVSLAIEHLESGVRFQHQADRPMPTASLIKLPLMITAYQLAENEAIDLDRKITLSDDDKVPGAGILRDHFSAGAQLSLRDYLRLMMRYSDNTATNVVIDQVALPTTTQRMTQWGLSNTRLHSKVYRGNTSIDPDRSRKFGIGSTTASEMIQLLRMLHNKEITNDAMTSEMIDHLLTCEDSALLKRSIDARIKFAHKTGAVSDCRTDAGILFTDSGPIAVCILTDENADRRWTKDNEAEILCGKIGQAIVNRFGSDSSGSPLQVGSSGRLVESLQRTLNARLNPSPGLAVDGDFGPATQKAVEQFQREQSLRPNGVVDSKTWQSLGTLIETDVPVPAPEVIHRRQLRVVQPPPLDDPPIVTCKAWVIGDANGEIIWSNNADRPLEAASTTKIMTAHLVLQLAKNDPSVLEEMITFSRRADRTDGSTTGIRAGERIDAGTLLFGLLLPSGNDAATAFAEHFGSSFDESATTDAASYDAFIREMNREAERLGLEKTRYTNPHGLSNRQHLIPAKSLLKLSSAAMQHPRFRNIVSTRQFGCRVTSKSGYSRNLQWTNTNRLLGIDGYRGIKTGTTSTAGACLVSTGERHGDTLTVVVLGSQSSSARYADSRNLFRWAWKKRLEGSESGNDTEGEVNHSDDR